MSENSRHVSTRPPFAPMNARPGKPPAGGVGSVRIIAGQWRGTRLPVPDRPGLRPTSDRVRETLFNWLQPVLPGARVLDLFAGTGALGLEALSRGAAEVTFVDDGAKALALLKANIAKMKAEGETRILRQDATHLGPHPGAPFTLVFLDPPYGKAMGEAALASAIVGGWLAPGAMVVWEENTAPMVPTGFPQVDRRTYGDTIVTLLKAPE